MRPPAVRWSAALAWAALGLCALEGAQGLVDTARATLRAPLGDRARAWTDPEDARLRRVLKEDWPTYRAVLEHVPEGERVLVSYDRRSTGPVRLLRLRTLLYPRTFRDYPYDPRRPDDGAPAEGGFEAWVLDLGSARDYARIGSVRELAAGPGFRLLRFGGEGG